MIKKLAVLGLVLLGAFTIVACKPTINVPEDEQVPSEPVVPDVPKEDDLVNIIFKEVDSTEDKALPKSASKIVFEDVYELDFNGIKGRAAGFALASGTGTGLKDEFILRSEKEKFGFLELNLTKEVKVELDLHMWFTKSNINWLGSISLNGEVFAQGDGPSTKDVKTFELTLKEGINRIEYKTTPNGYNSQLVFKELRFIK